MRDRDEPILCSMNQLYSVSPNAIGQLPELLGRLVVPPTGNCLSHETNFSKVLRVPALRKLVGAKAISISWERLDRILQFVGCG